MSKEQANEKLRSNEKEDFFKDGGNKSIGLSITHQFNDMYVMSTNGHNYYYSSFERRVGLKDFSCVTKTFT